MSDSAQNFDVIILGVGHQSLVSANYLAKSGFSVCVLDAPIPASGATPYTDFHEGLKSGPCAHTPIPLNRKILDELNLKEYGFDAEQQCHDILSIAKGKDPFVFIGQPDGHNYVNTIADIAPNDYARLIELHEQLAELAQVMSNVDLSMPEYTQKGWKDIWAIFETAKHLATNQDALQKLFADLMTMSLTQFLEQNFETETLRGMLAFQSILGSMINPDQEGSAAFLAMHVLALGENPLFGENLQPLRGSIQPLMKALTQAGIANGVSFNTGATVTQILLENNQFKGIETDTGVFTAPLLIADINPQILFLDLIDETKIQPEFKLRISNMSNANGFIRVKLALKELPQFTCLEGKDPASYLKGNTLIAPDINYVRTAFDQTMNEGGSQRPNVSMVIPSLSDPELMADGLHCCSLVGQYFEPNLPDTKENKIAVAQAITAAVNDFAPNFQDSVVTFLPIMGEAFDKTLGPLNPDLTGGTLPLTRFLRSGLTHHSLFADLPFEGMYICGYGPESSANAHLTDFGYHIAKHVNQTRKPSAAA